MIAIKRLSEPKILLEKKATWLKDFLSSGKKRPDSSKYAHKEIKEQLNSMSFKKCFYCETLLEGYGEVDHHIEVSIKKELAFDWNNLYLSCKCCNRKVSHSDIPISDALDPCKNTNTEIQEHLTFNDEFIEAKNNSKIGLNTIKKYRLNSDILDYKRLKNLKQFYKLLLKIKENKIKDSRKEYTFEEKNDINSFGNENHCFSLMFNIYIAKLNIQ